MNFFILSNRTEFIGQSWALLQLYSALFYDERSNRQKTYEELK